MCISLYEELHKRGRVGAATSQLPDSRSGPKPVVHKTELFKCEYQTGKEIKFNAHNCKVHNQGEHHMCEHCAYSTSHKGRFTAHMMEVHGKGELLKCIYCKYQTNYRTSQVVSCG